MQSNVLHQHPDFMKLWVGQTVSQFGSMVTRDALPFIAVLVLRASPLQMGLLSASEFAPVLLIGLLAGVWVDRLRRRPILIAADLARAVLVASVPAAALLGWLSMTHLYVVAALAGVLTVFFDVAYQSYLPTLVQREHVLEGNSKLGLTASLAEVVVPGLTGFLVQVVSAPLTLLFDAASFLFSAGSLALIRAPEPRRAPSGAGPRPGVREEIADGLRGAFEHPLLRATIAATATRDFFGSFFGALYALYALDVLGLSPWVVGVLVGCGGAGALVGAILAQRFTQRLGMARALRASMFVMSLFTLFIPLAGGALWVRVLFMFLAQFCGDLFLAIYEIDALSLRQSVTADHRLGRVNASVRVITGTLTLLGLLVGGALGQFAGIRPAVWVAALGGLLAGLWLVRVPGRPQVAGDCPP